MATPRQFFNFYKQQTSCLIYDPPQSHHNSSTSAISTPHLQAPKMFAPRLLLVFFFFFLHNHFSTSNGVSVLALDSVQTNDIDVMVRRFCTQSIEDCLAEAEPEMDSETSRRVLVMQKKYISYETLKRDMVPCVRPGASYYDCQARVANPYNRGCEVITRCARDIKDTKN